jgi:hypothetical protein
VSSADGPSGNSPASIEVLPDPGGGPAGALGPVRTIQAAELEVPADFVERHWDTEHLERLARSYWAYLERISLGLLKVLYAPSSRTVTLLGWLPLLRFRKPRYLVAKDLGQVSWPVERGFLVSPAGRGRGFLRITITRLGSASGGRVRVRVSSEVSNFYPGLRLAGRLSRVGAWIYNQTQMRIHVLITRGFLRSLTRLELPESRVGAMRKAEDRALTAPAEPSASSSSAP